MSMQKGDRVYVAFGKREEAGVIQDIVNDGFGHEPKYKIELLAVNPFSPDQLLRSLYPTPILIHRLTLRYVDLPGEVQS